MLAARIAAFTAPGFPTASVPTGTPAGIWTIDSSESSPESLDSSGTPSTGSVVFAATAPGNAAAPPAAAMITSRPRSSAVAAYSASSSGVRWAESTRVSNGTPRDSRVSAVCRIVSQSDLEPMITPTSGSATSLLPSPVLQPAKCRFSAAPRPAGGGRVSDRITRLLAGYASGVTAKGLPAETIHEVKRRVLDSIGVAMAGLDGDAPAAARAYAAHLPDPNGATLWGSALRANPEVAGFANGVAVRYLDFNDPYPSRDPPQP